MNQFENKIFSKMISDEPTSIPKSNSSMIKSSENILDSLSDLFPSTHSSQSADIKLNKDIETIVSPPNQTMTTNEKIMALFNKPSTLNSRLFSF